MSRGSLLLPPGITGCALLTVRVFPAGVPRDITGRTPSRCTVSRHAAVLRHACSLLTSPYDGQPVLALGRPRGTEYSMPYDGIASAPVLAYPEGMLY